ncbi:unnamed protein product [Boreogadus saida]
MWTLAWMLILEGEERLRGGLVADGNSDVLVNFDPDPADLALSSVPGQEAFDPRRHRFSDEELKPQPMIKKARKMLVPNEQKGTKRNDGPPKRGAAKLDSAQKVRANRRDKSREIGEGPQYEQKHRRDPTPPGSLCTERKEGDDADMTRH